MKLGFNTTGNSQTSGRTTLAIMGLGSLRNTKGSLTRKYKYCEKRDPNYLFQCVFNQPIPLSVKDGALQTIGCIEGSILTSTDYGKTWTSNTQYINTSTFIDVAMSSNGIYRTIVDVNNNDTFYTYNQNTKLWTKPSFTPNDIQFSNVAMSNDGKYQTVYNGWFTFFNTVSQTTYLISSVNYGSSWTNYNNPFNDEFCFSLSIGYNGQNQLASTFTNGYTYLYYSNNYGISWDKLLTAPLNPNGPFFCVNVSGNNNYTVATYGFFQTSFAQIYTSTDTITWNQSTINLPSPNYVISLFSQIKSSTSGKYQLANSTIFTNPDTGYLFLSSDYGSTWNPIMNIPNNNSNSHWSSISVSNSGQLMTALAAVAFQIVICFQSQDYGKTWNILNNLPLNTLPLCIAIS
jgi:photosystem II stability/assembly factor-like uncharacterized protein